MLTLEKLREIEPKFKDIKDEELAKIRDAMRDFAELAFECWLDDINKK